MALIGEIWLSPAMLPELAALTGTHRTTVARWYAKRRLPAAVARLMELIGHGRLERIHAAWSGWRLDPKSGELVTPLGEAFGPGEIQAMTLRYHQIAALKAEIRALRDAARAPRANVAGAFSL